MFARPNPIPGQVGGLCRLEPLVTCLGIGWLLRSTIRQNLPPIIPPIQAMNQIMLAEPDSFTRGGNHSFQTSVAANRTIVSAVNPTARVTPTQDPRSQSCGKPGQRYADQWSFGCGRRVTSIGGKPSSASAAALPLRRPEKLRPQVREFKATAYAIEG
jgi:hypothetical protein